MGPGPNATAALSPRAATARVGTPTTPTRLTPAIGRRCFDKEVEAFVAAKEPKKDEVSDPTSNRGHRCMQNVHCTFFAFRAMFPIVSLAP